MKIMDYVPKNKKFLSNKIYATGLVNFGKCFGLLKKVKVENWFGGGHIWEKLKIGFVKFRKCFVKIKNWKIFL
jgi:hypothetical protein